jgi:hypothetical protein
MLSTIKLIWRSEQDKTPVKTLGFVNSSPDFTNPVITPKELMVEVWTENGTGARSTERSAQQWWVEWKQLSYDNR